MNAKRWGYCLIIFIGILCHAAVQFALAGDGDKLVKKRGVYLKKVEINPNLLSDKTYATISVAEIDVSNISDNESITAGECQYELRIALMGETAGFSSPVFIFDKSTQPADALLNLSITKVNPGNQFARFVFGEFGGGEIQVEIKGEVIDTETGKTIMRFKEKRGKTGALEFKNTTTEDSAPGLIRDVIIYISRDMAREISRLLK